MPDPISSVAPAPDAELVAATLAGDRRAFGEIVERYQRLLCSLAYSATGQISQSEDLAQETFVEAWRQLAGLREPEKLRPWLCGILRFKVSRLRRADGREPVRQADPLAAAETVESGEEPTADLVVRKEEQALLWSALERVPEIYREPLVLFYREHRSVEHVAAALDLTEDAVKQRLARGRKVLQEQVLAFVEGALARSTPGKLFTIAVLAALPAVGTPTVAKAATVGVGAGLAAKGGALAKTTLLATLLASWVGVANAVLSLRAALDQSRTPKERKAVVKVTLAFVLGCFAFLGVLWLLRAAAWRWWEQRAVFAGVAQALSLAMFVAWPLGLMRALRCMRTLRASERREHPEAFRDARDQIGARAGTYRSRLTLLGVPLVHIRFATPDAGEPPVVGWIAGGDRAYGLIAAWGAFTVAPLSVGSVGIGLVTVGNFSVGVISLGTVAVGWIALGCVSAGANAIAWLSALGWHSARSGGFAVARLAAEGPVAFAAHANDAAAHALLADPHAERNMMLFLGMIVLFGFVPVVCFARAVRQRLGRRRA